MKFLAVSVFTVVFSLSCLAGELTINGETAESTQTSLSRMLASLDEQGRQVFVVALMRVQLSEVGSATEAIEAGLVQSLNYELLGSKLDGLSYSEILELAEQSPTKASISSSGSEPSPAGLIEVDSETLPRFWVADQETVEISFTSNETAALLEGGGRTSGWFWIAPDGKVTRVEIEESEPAGVFDEATIRNYMARTYTPTDENPDRYPAKVRFESNFQVTVK